MLHQLDIFEVLDRDWKESKIEEVLSLIKEHDPTMNVAAVYIFPEYAKGAEPSFATKENGKYKIFGFWHGMLNKNHFLLRDELPNSGWISLSDL